MKNTKRRQAGVSLIEVLIATVFISIVVIASAFFISKSTQNQVRNDTRNFAATQMNSTLSSLKSRPYLLVTPTPAGAYFPVAANCDCSSADFTTLPSTQTITDGKVLYTQAVCINLVKRTAAGAWQSQCPGTTDTGLKNVVVSTTWKAGKDTQSLTTSTLLSKSASATLPPTPVGQFTLTLCQQVLGQPLPTDPHVAAPPATCANSGTALDGAEVAIYKNGFLADTQAVGNAPHVLTLAVPSDNGYQVQVQQTGYFPFHWKNENIAAGTTDFMYVYLRKIGDYSSSFIGEAATTDTPVISKIIDAVSQPTDNTCTPSGNCQNAAEALEIYNPTVSTFTFAPGGLQIKYCNTGACYGPYPTATPPFAFNVKNNTLLPGSYLLIVGKDLTAGVNPAPPSAVAGVPADWNVTPDVTYDVHDPGLPTGASGIGLIP